MVDIQYRSWVFERIYVNSLAKEMIVNKFKEQKTFMITFWA